jgi:hypothetical protein
MRQILVLFLLLSLGAANNNATNEELPRWMRAVEEILASQSIANPLRPEFTPAYLAKRTRAGALKTQVARFRAAAASSMVECLDTKARLCPAPTISEEAVTIVLDELKALGFEAIQVLNADWCYKRAGVQIEVLAPSKENNN